MGAADTSGTPRGRGGLPLGVVVGLALAVWAPALWPPRPAARPPAAGGGELTPWERVARRYGDPRTDAQIRADNRLMHAVWAGDVVAARRELAAGADPNARSLDPCGPGGTPLVEASGRGEVEMVGLLLAGGADPNLGVDDDTPLAAAARGGHTKVASRLVAAGARGGKP